MPSPIEPSLYSRLARTIDHDIEHMNAFLILLGIVGLAVAGEIFCWVYAKATYNSRRYVNHTLLGWKLLPDRKAYRRFIPSEPPRLCTTDKHGLPNPRTYDFKKTDGISRILLLGDSFTEDTYNQAAESTFPTLMVRQLNGCEVVNSGCSGWSTDQEYLYFKTDGYRYAPDLVILVISHNDFLENLSPVARSFSGREKPLFRLEDGRLTLVRKPNALFSYLRDHLYLFLYLRAKANALRYQLTGWLPWPEGSEEEAYDLMKALILRLQEESRSRGVLSFAVARTYCSKDLQSGQADEVLRNFAESEQIPYLDLFDHLRSAPEKVFYDHCHVNERGAQVVGNAMASFVKSEFPEIVRLESLGLNRSRSEV